MSHFSVLVIGPGVDKQLEPYDESIEVAPYSAGIVSDAAKESMLDFYNSKKGYNYSSFEECNKEKGEDWNGGSYVKMPNGEWHEMSRYNPNSKWDWYQTGGRWSNMLHTNEGDKNSALKKDITNIRELKLFAIVKNGIWFEKGEMGWWGMVSNEKGENEWSQIQETLIDEAGEDDIFTIVDCHI